MGKRAKKKMGTARRANPARVPEKEVKVPDTPAIFLISPPVRQARRDGWSHENFRRWVDLTDGLLSFSELFSTMVEGQATEFMEDNEDPKAMTQLCQRLQLLAVGFRREVKAFEVVHDHFTYEAGYRDGLSIRAQAGDVKLAPAV